MQAKVYQVGELANEMRDLLEMSYANISIEGELSTLSQPASGHLYFTLKDDAAQIRCAMFRSSAQRLTIKPKVGDRVMIRGKVSVYTARGDLQCIAQSMELAGQGALYLAFEQLKQKLAESGLFDAQRKRELPRFVQSIGVISSTNAAALSDILTTLERRCPNVKVSIYPSLVQGNEAERQLIQAVEFANQVARDDVLILARGGGSIEDLWSFNSESLAHAIAKSKIPIISAVGHETDFTIADFVADVRAPTPTAAAELAAPDSKHLTDQVNQLFRRCSKHIRTSVESWTQSVDSLQYRLIHPNQKIAAQSEKLAALQRRLQQLSRQQLGYKQEQFHYLQKRVARLPLASNVRAQQDRVKQLGRALNQASSLYIKNKRQELKHVSESLHMVSPLATLDRGYSIARDAAANVLRSARKDLEGQKIQVKLAQGELSCEVLEANDAS